MLDIFVPQVELDGACVLAVGPRNFFSVNFTKLLASEAVKLPFQVDVHLARHPLFVAFGEQGGHEAQARSGVWED